MADPITIAMIAQGAASAGAGVIGFIGALREKEALENQAERAALLGTYNARITKNNAIAQSQNADFQAGVEKFNQKSTVHSRDFEFSQREKDARRRRAATEANMKRLGLAGESLDDILDSEAMLAEELTMEIFRQRSERSYQYSSQANRNQYMSRRIIEQGEHASLLAKNEGLATSASFYNKSKTAELKAYGTILGSAASTTQSFIDLPN